ncbi:hypothetical protein RRG08_015948 [Elysia crispata]|uniref:Uncharacterized protein n=1 Tax=Elysia crispata TaxID=231223 RepID=A0AAE1AMG1_9GAST|nr:hypothetical protein RRG08_015948 [Elysia crispata]
MIGSVGFGPLRTKLNAKDLEEGNKQMRGKSMRKMRREKTGGVRVENGDNEYKEVGADESKPMKEREKEENMQKEGDECSADMVTRRKSQKDDQ